MSYPLVEAENQIKKLLEDALSSLNYKCDLKLETPPDDSMGDFAFPCFILAPIAKKAPNKIAEEIASKVKENKWVKKVDFKGAYVNFFLDESLISELTLKKVFEKKDKYGQLDKKNKKVIVEHTSANPNGPLHVGRARNPIIGDTIYRIFKAAGYTTESQFYLDDMGKQVGILAWGVNNVSKKDVPEAKYAKADHQTVGYYQVASKRLKEDDSVAEELGRIVKKLEEGDEKTIEMVHKAYKPILEGMKESMSRINISVDSYVPESKFLKDKSVDKVIEKIKESNHCQIEDGAYYIDMKPFGVQGRNTKFFIARKDGTTLYATRDVAYHLWKANNADMLVNVLGEDHKLESKQVEIALGIVESKLIPQVIFYSFVSLPGGKMSTRKARVVYLDELIDECISRAYAEVKKRRGSELTDKQMKEIAEIVGTGALRYNIIKVQPEKDIVFKWEEALNFEGNSAPFIQYAHARACSILSKSKENVKDFDSKLLTHESEIQLIKKIAKMPVIIYEACSGFKPHIIANYLFEVASQFNQFYRDCPVLPEENKELRIARLALVDATRFVIKNSLDLLGITAPDEM